MFIISQQQRRERELRKQQEREQRRRYEEMEQLRREEERRHAEREQVHICTHPQSYMAYCGCPIFLAAFINKVEGGYEMIWRIRTENVYLFRLLYIDISLHNLLCKKRWGC